MGNSPRIVHYVNQFFGGVGGEEKANQPVEVRPGPVGPGRPLAAILAQQAEIVATIIGGDNYVSENRDEALATVRSAFEELRPNVVVAGPAFDAGRYGSACGAVCALATSELGIPSVTAMHPENAAVALYRRQTYIIPTGNSAVEMPSVLPRIARLALKLGTGQPLDEAAAEGYLPRGIRRYQEREKPAYERATEMVLARILGQPWTSEVGVQSYEVVAPAPPIRELAGTKIALVTSGGLVPKGNPDRLPSGNVRDFFRYSIQGIDALGPGEWESIHGGFSTVVLNTRNPAYVLPLPVLREKERRGQIGEIYPYYFATVGNGTSVTNAKGFGQAIASELKEADVRAVVLVAT
jgi:glycine reductase complex component B subunit gamma